MAAILEKLQNTVIAGVVLLVIVLVVVGATVSAPSFDHAWFAFLFRYLHVLSGILWIGLLWYFNFVQIPTMPKIPAELKPAVSKFIAPEALFWFRWAALATVVTGVGLAIVKTQQVNGYIWEVLTF